MHNNFTVGDKVVCVDDDFSKCWMNPNIVFPSLPKKGVVYVVKELAVALNGEAGIKIIGCESFCKDGMFYPRRFRLLTEMKQDSEVAIKPTHWRAV
jgi:hypothetical protein